MNLPTETFGHVIVVHAPEDLGADHADGFRNFCCGLDRSQVVLDLDGTESIDSEGLEALLDVQDELRRQGGELKAATTNGYNRKILEITRLDQEIEVFGSVIEAAKSFR